MKKLVSISVLTNNEKEELKLCLNCILQQTYQNIELIVVDNASADGTQEMLEKEFFHKIKKIIINKENKGCAGGNNIGIQASKGEYIIICDANFFMHNKYVEEMVSAIENHSEKKIGMAQGKLFRLKNLSFFSVRDSLRIIDSTGVYLTKTYRNFDRGAGCEDIGQFDKQELIFGAGGTAPIYKREMLENVKLNNEVFDEDFFIYREEIDFDWRCKNLGWKCLYVPAATGFHIRTYSPETRKRLSNDLKKLQFRNRYFMIIKNATLFDFISKLGFFLSFEIAALLYIIAKEKELLKVYRELFIMFPKMLSKRRMISKIKKPF